MKDVGFSTLPVAVIALTEIDAQARLRPVKDHRVAVLVQDIDFQGLLSPLVVARTGNRFVLVDGAHRLAALRQLGHEDAPARILEEGLTPDQLAFAEIMANVDREDLTALERAEHLFALKAAWANLNPSARHGGDRRSAAVRAVKEAEAEAADQSAILALCSEIAEQAGLSRRSFFRATAIAKGLDDAVKARVRGTWLEDNQAGLQALAAEEAPMQVAICDVLFADPPRAGNVADAKTIALGHRLPPVADKQYAGLVSTWSRLPKISREAFIETHQREFLDVARKKGWSL